MAAVFLSLVASLSWLPSPQPSPMACVRSASSYPDVLGSNMPEYRSHTRKSVLRGAAALAGLSLGAAAANAGDEEVIFKGVLQIDKPDFILPDGAVAEVICRVVGRGSIATLNIPAGGTKFPVEFVVKRGDLRAELPEFIWLEDDIYLKAEVKNAKGKVVLAGKSKSKAIIENGKPTHGISYVTVE